jgi:hypothetical protein
MTTSTPTGRTPVFLRDPAQLLAAVPYVLGFRPGNSVVLIGHRAPEGCHLGLVLHAELPARQDRARQARALAPRFTTAPHTGVTLAVIGGRRRSGGPPPHAGFVDELVDAFADVGLPVLHPLWAADIAEGARWGCYRAESCGGVLPEPSSTLAATVAIGNGTVVFDSRDELAALLAPRSPEALARRAETLSGLSEPPWPEATRVSHGTSAICAALGPGRGNEGPLDDETAIRLAAALTIPEVRDTCLAMAVPPGSHVARAAERLWLTMVRELPPPQRAEPATLLGYSAFMRGDGAFAGMALENALEAAPNHLLARLLSTVLDRGMPPEELLGLAMAAEELASAGSGPGCAPPRALDRTAERPRELSPERPGGPG